MSCKSLLLVALVACAMILSWSGVPSHCYAADPCEVQHPLDPPDGSLTGQCPNCGMGRPMWARTWMTFENSRGKSESCSFHCLADVAVKSGEDLKNVKVASYLEPSKMLPAETAWFVVGSKAKGTMTMTSKLAFPSQQEAQRFAESCGGKVMNFAETFALAKEAIAQENKVINERRIKSGKIVEPEDNKDRCMVCQMYPARYPKNKSQLHASGNQVHHFCSTQCLFEFLEHPEKYGKDQAKPMMIWVVDYSSGDWISAKTAYYVVGSKAKGPMGAEAFAFDNLQAAKSFADKEGGEVLTMDQVTMGKLVGK